ncbi:MAG: hypothetical protein FRX48_02317 [Lasallia pustulata]|uniref:Uncharacterized protein n=1 Tax=Lasallia pustulata TaxID=136370 RepID=A0A5M8PWD9_9LECA|nr:MAG: hypothetical protein FRX48_02317 [Lasallia pustulata]
MSWNPVLVVTFWILVLRTMTEADDIAKIIRTHFDGHRDFKRQNIATLWRELLRDLPEWKRTVANYEMEDALVLDIVAAVEDGRARVPTFPREVQPGALCSEQEVEEVRAWMCSGGA